MKRTFQKIACVALACVALMLASCNEAAYVQDVNTLKLAAQLMQKTPTARKWVNEDQAFIKEYVNLENVKESQIFYAQNTNDLDEFGVFEAEDGKAKEVRNQLLQGYLQKRYTENREWYDSYMPTETPKLRDAEVRIYGNCVVYAILSPERRTTFFSECEKLLKEQK